ncbi:hypothetical protein [Flavobacterium sp. GCM10027622]|uniref:hypothetical protein n=1 Tax=unclassified Flavobacterium TaxID=196869 RepID=UPI00361C52E9
MNTSHKFRRAIATFFLLIFLPTLVPANLYANNNGPVAPEAASFEPVDATDMVNLATGDMSYVMPLINVPSPEGGYPLALSYHAGIAMEQEASWVGLGWTLNPGAINRSVNGTPDDWFQKKTSDFFYDAGDTVDSFSFSIGGTFGNGVTVGLGASWGSHQAFGGNVMLGYGGLTGSIGTNGQWGVGVGGFNIGTNGASLDVGLGSAGAYGLNVALNYDVINNDLKGSVGVNTGIFNYSLDTSFTTGETSSNSNIRISKSTNTSTQGQYDVKISNSETGVNLGIFWFNYGHRRVEYSLFDINNFTESGSLYPEAYKIGFPDETLRQTYNNVFSPTLSGDFKTDTEMTSLGRGYSFGFDTQYEGYTGSGAFGLITNYDGYRVDAQGMSGQIIPYNLSEEFISRPGYNVSPTIDNNNLLGGKINFRFSSSINSFLRNNKRELISNGTVNQAAFNAIRDEIFAGNLPNLPRQGSVYSQTVAPSGDLIKNGNRLREGSFVETFTNEQIISGNAPGFIEAKSISRSDNPDFTSELKGIGAYRVTTVDGKTYHYSLPVYQMESHFKSLSDKNNENSKFYESSQKYKYATHWLLTAITGPDYIDSNLNGQVDDQDYGYWVEFQYGKWSDGYLWRSPHVGYKETPSKNPTEDPTYRYYWGRKQVYYLDVIKTRTHSALFVKKMRQDDESNTLSIYSSKINNATEFDRSKCSRYVTQRTDLKFGSKGDVFYYANGTSYTVAHNRVKGKRGKYAYLDIPKTYSLALDKVLLIKNKDLDLVNKSRGNLTTNSEGYTYEGYGYTNVKGYLGEDSFIMNINDLFSDTGSGNLSYFKTNLHQNVLDEKDIEGLNIEGKSSKNLKFIHNYELAKQTVNSNSPQKGRLALERIEFHDKNDVSYMPAYKFDYHDKNLVYNKSDEDVWGYHKTNSKIWSLSKIETPTGGEINFEYENDSYRRQAIIDEKPNVSNIVNRPYGFKKTSQPQSYGYLITDFIKQDGKLYITSNTSYDPSNGFSTFFHKNKEVNLEFKQGTQRYFDRYEVEDYKITRQGLDSKFEVTLKQTENTLFYGMMEQDFYPSNYNYANINTDPPKLDMVGLIIPFDTYTTPDSRTGNPEYYSSNGKPGGGLRVKSVSLRDKSSNAIISKEDYSYLNPYSGKISGITSYTPFDEYKFIPMLTFLPAPGVNYQYVTVSKKNGNDELVSKNLYEFNVIKPANYWFGLSNENNQFFSGVSYGDILYANGYQKTFVSYRTENGSQDTYNMTGHYGELKSNYGLLGALKRLKIYNNQGQVLSERSVCYNKIGGNGTDETGVKESSFLSSTSHSTTGQGIYVHLLSLQDYPSFEKSVTVLENGKSSTVYYDKYDFLSGKLLETRKETSDGKIFKTKVVPAYTKYSAMGSKTENVNNRNMLSQEAAEFTYILDNNVWKETGVGITTWSNEWTYQDIQGNLVTPTADKEKIWRKHKMFIWNGQKDDGIFRNFNDDFNWNIGVGQSSNWKQISEVTKYDHYSMTLEAKDVNNNHAATKMGDKETKITAVGNAKYNELYYSGLENIDGVWLEPGMSLNGATRDITKSHSGKYSLAVNSPGKLNIDLKDNQHKAGRYKLNVWVHKDNAGYARLLINGATVSFNGPSKQAGDWILKTHYFDMTTAATTVSLIAKAGATVYYDDIMLRPIASSVTGYVYNEWDEMTHIIGNNGIATRFEYDAAGRLVKTYVEVFDDQSNGLTGGFKLSSENKIHYKNL